MKTLFRMINDNIGEWVEQGGVYGRSSENVWIGADFIWPGMLPCVTHLGSRPVADTTMGITQPKRTTVRKR